VDTLVKQPNKRRSAILSKNSDIITQRLREGDELTVLDLLALLVQKYKYWHSVIMTQRLRGDGELSCAEAEHASSSRCSICLLY
jgi:hypothetical protein